MLGNRSSLGPDLVALDAETNCRALFDVATPGEINTTEGFLQLQVEPAP